MNLTFAELTEISNREIADKIIQIIEKETGKEELLEFINSLIIVANNIGYGLFNPWIVTQIKNHVGQDNILNFTKQYKKDNAEYNAEFYLNIQNKTLEIKPRHENSKDIIIKLENKIPREIKNFLREAFNGDEAILNIDKF